MTIEQRIKALSLLGKRLQTLGEYDMEIIIQKAKSENPWFTDTNIKMAWTGILKFLNASALQDWASEYDFSQVKAKTIAVVMAGNIPLVGFHDFLCVLISGHSIQIKLSSKDSVLIHYMASNLIEIEPEFASRISFTERLKDFDAVIATGSDNSSRYFDYYFGKYPNIIRKNRTSCAILTGDETEDDFRKLGIDIFSYFGLGCRNVSKIFVPKDYSFSDFFGSLEIFQPIINHHKYCNNYDYQKSIMLVNGVKFLDNGFLMLTEDGRTVSPISVIYYETYTDLVNLNDKLATVEDKLQCIVGKIYPATLALGQAQYPELRDYADQIDTLQFLSDLR